MAFLTLVFVLVAANIYGTIAAPAATYDQQQTGDLNVQVHFKDIQIVALLDSEILGDYGDYDYAYDYSDFTLKPITHHTTTARPSSTGKISTSSAKPWHTWPTISSGSSTPSTTSAPAQPEVQSAHVDVNPLLDDVDPLSPPESVEDSGKADREKKPGSALEKQKVSSAAEDDEESPEASPVDSQTKLTTGLIKDTSDAGDNSEEKDTLEDVPATKPVKSSSSTQENPPSIIPQQETSQSPPIEQPQQQMLKKCSPGHGRDQKGRCNRLHIRRRLPSALLPFGIRLAPRVYRKRDELRVETSEN